jgi:hypothetical protein
MDVESVKPLDNLLADFELILSKLVGISNAIMGSAPKHPLWLKVFEELTNRQHNLDHKTMPLYVGYSTGPIMLNDCVVGGKFDQNSTVLVCPGYIFEPGAPMELHGKIFKSHINPVTLYYTSNEHFLVAQKTQDSQVFIRVDVRTILVC